MTIDATAGTPAIDATARFARGPLLGAIVVAFGWHLASNAPSMMSRLDYYHSPALAVAQWVVFALVGVVAAADALRGRRRPGTAVLGILVLQAVVVVQVLTSSPALALNVGDWAWSNFGWFAILVLWRWPLPWLLGAMAANTLITLAILLVVRDMDRVTLARFAMVVLGAGAIQVALAAGGRSLEAVARRAYQARSEPGDGGDRAGRGRAGARRPAAPLPGDRSGRPPSAGRPGH